MTREELQPHHDAVLSSWRDLILRSGSLAMADRIVVFVQLQYRGQQLSTLEGLAQDSVDLKQDTEAFVESVRQNSPLTTAVAVYSAISGVLGFFGLWSFSKLKEMSEPALDAAQVGAAQTAAAIAGVLAVISGGALYYLARGAFLAMQAAADALNDFNARDRPSATLLRAVHENERDLFALFGRQVPSRPVSAGPLILLGGACIVAGAIFAGLVGIGSSRAAASTAGPTRRLMPHATARPQPDLHALAETWSLGEVVRDAMVLCGRPGSGLRHLAASGSSTRRSPRQGRWSVAGAVPVILTGRPLRHHSGTLGPKPLPLLLSML